VVFSVRGGAMDLEPVEIDESSWTRGTSGRLWYGQPATTISGAQPIVPLAEGGKTVGLRLLEATLKSEGVFPAPEGAPAFIVLPEFAVHPTEAQAAIALAKGTRRNTVVVFGLGHITDAQAQVLEPGANLWDGPAEGRLTNCAVVVFGGSGRTFLQPKIVRSRWEEGGHWPGRVVRYFVGQNYQFIVVICSELLDRPDGATTARAIVDRLDERGRQLSLVVWIQHNPRPRSPEFAAGIEEFVKLRSTTVVVGSRAVRSTARLNKFAVSGAFLPHDSLPNHFDLLTKRFHYVEPVPDVSRQSRLVLLRYDADVYRVQTTLARWVDGDDRAARGALFEEAQPYILDGEALAPSNSNAHLEDICARPVRIACDRVPRLTVSIRKMAEQLCSLGTVEFMAVLDVGVLPRSPIPGEHHVAGVMHPAGDGECRCWRHRECIDFVSDEEASAEPVAHLLAAMAAIDVAGLIVRFVYDRGRRTNLVIRLGVGDMAVGLVFPFHLDAEGTEEGIWGRDRVSLIDSAYIVLGVGERAALPSMRLRVASIDSAMARPVGAIRAGMAAAPVLRAVYAAEFWKAEELGSLREVLGARFLEGR